MGAAASIEEASKRLPDLFMKAPYCSVGEATKLADREPCIIIGRVSLPVGGAQVLTPVSRRPCVHYRIKIEKKMENGQYTRVVKDRVTMDFLLADGSATKISVPMTKSPPRLFGRSGAGFSQNNNYMPVTSANFAF